MADGAGALGADAPGAGGDGAADGRIEGLLELDLDRSRRRGGRTSGSA